MECVTPEIRGWIAEGAGNTDQLAQAEEQSVKPPVGRWFLGDWV